MNTFPRAVMLLLALTLLEGRPADAQQLLNDAGVEVIYALQQPSRIKLENRTIRYDWALLLTPRERTFSYDELRRYHPLPACSERKVKRLPIVEKSPAIAVFDMLYYSAEDPRQVARARAFTGPKRAYEPLLAKKRPHGDPDYWQQFARLVELPCLPARFSFDTDGPTAYITYRLGEAAWE